MKAKQKIYLALLLTLLITFGSLYTGDQKIIKHVFISDKIIHAFSYFVLTLSWLIALRSKLKKQKKIVLLAIVLICYGIILEALQEILTSVRTAEFSDVIANSVGVLIAILLFKILLKKRMLIK